MIIVLMLICNIWWPVQKCLVQHIFKRREAKLNSECVRMSEKVLSQIYIRSFQRQTRGSEVTTVLTAMVH